MNFLNLVELVSSMFSQQAREPRHESSTDDHRQVAEARFLIEGEETADLRSLVGSSDHWNSSVNRSPGQHCLGPAGRSNHHRGHRPVHLATNTKLSAVPQRINQPRRGRSVRISDLDTVDAARRT